MTPEYFLTRIGDFLYLNYRERGTNQCFYVAFWKYGDSCPYFKMPTAFTLADDLALNDVHIKILYNNAFGYWLTAHYDNN